MKKALVVLLILAVAGGAFAQGITFTGELNTGIGLLINDVKESNPAIGMVSAKSGFTSRVNLTGTYANSENTAGARFQIRGNAGLGATSAGDLAMLVPLYEAWFKLMDNMIEIRAGQLDSGGPFGTGGGINSSYDIGGGPGMFFHVTPMSGLDLRFGMFGGPLGQAASVTTDEATTNRNLLGNFRYNLGVRYLVPDTVDVVFHFIQGARGNAYWAPWKAMDIGLGFKVLMLRDMGFSTLALDADFRNLQQQVNGEGNSAYKTDMNIRIGQNIVYNVDSNIQVGARFLQSLLMGGDGAKSSNYSPDLTFTLYGQYVMGDIVPRIDFGLNMGRGLRGLTGQDYRGAGAWDSTNKGNGVDGSGPTGHTKNAMNLTISPSVQFRFGASNRFIELGYVMQRDMSSGDAKPHSDSLSMNNLIYAQFRVGF